jgi:MFS family permease
MARAAGACYSRLTLRSNTAMQSSTRLLLGGFLTLAVVMGIGRFYYTPMLPLMQRDFGFDTATAGLIGSVNFAAYIVGSVGAVLVRGGAVRLWMFRGAVILSVAATIGMGLTDSLALWLMLRAVAGIVSALGMILSAAYLAEALAAIEEPGRIGWLFGGVGAGIAASGILVNFTHEHLSSSTLWIVAGIGCLLLLPVILAEVGDRQLTPRPYKLARRRRAPRPLSFPLVLTAYSLEGLGFSVFAVFIVAIVKSRPGLEQFGDWVWVAAGLAGLPTCLFWAWLAERIGFARSAVIAFLVQAVGLALPALSDGGLAAVAGAVLWGGTFLGIVVLANALGRHGVGGRGFAVMTVGYGTGQVAGPLAAGFLVTGPADWNIALFASSVVVAIGAAALITAMFLGPAGRPGD